MNVPGSSSLVVWASSSSADFITKSVVGDVARISVDMGRDMASRVTTVIQYLRDDSLAVNVIKYKNFLVKSLVEQPERVEFGVDDVAATALSILIFIFSLCTDMALAVCFYDTGNIWWCGATLAALWIPLVIVNILSLVWYNSKDHPCSVEPIILKITSFFGPPAALLVCYFMHFILLGQVYRSLVMLYYGMKTWEADHSAERSNSSSFECNEISDPDRIEVNDVSADTLPDMKVAKTIDFYNAYIHQDRDLTTLDIIDGFLHDGTQVILQIYVLSLCHPFNDDAFTTPVYPETNYTTIAQETSSAFPNISSTASSNGDMKDRSHTQKMMSIQSIVISLVIVSWSFARYVKVHRMNSAAKKKINLLGMLTQFIWHMYTLIPRVTALALFASACGSWLLIAVMGGHWACMTIWVRWQRAQPCKEKPNGIPFNIWEMMVVLVISYIYNFCFFNIRNEPTKRKYFIFYSLIFFEDTTILTMWYFNVINNPGCHYSLALAPLDTVFILTFMYLIGIFYLVLYYKCCHPNGRRAVRICSSREEAGSDDDEHEEDKERREQNSSENASTLTQAADTPN